MLHKFLLNFNFYFIRGILILIIVISCWFIIWDVHGMIFWAMIVGIGVVLFTPPFILSLVLFYFYRKKRNLIVESIFIILYLLISFWIVYDEVTSKYSRSHSFKYIDEEAFYLLWFWSFLLALMIISFFKFRKTLSS